MAKKTNLKTSLVMAVILLGFGCASASGGVIYVDADASTGGDGTTWGTAYKYLQDALADANSNPDVNDIWVAQGIYTPDSNSADPNGTGDRTATFQLISGVALYGGFAGGETTLAQRDWQTNQTILSGDLDGNDTPGLDPCDLLNDPNRGENSYHVVTGSYTEPNAIMDGFTITAGNANGSSPNNVGGGMLNYYPSGSPTLTNCAFSDNSAGVGGGMYNDFQSNPTLTNCTFSGNSATYGGGMFNISSPTVTNCTFSGNSANDNGGGMYNFPSSSQTTTNCTFSGNSASNYGGGMFNSSNSTVTNCMFSGNSANFGGGMHNSTSSNAAVTNCTFSGNSATQGDALACDSWQQQYPSNIQLANCILWDSGNEIWNNDGSTITITYSDVQGSWAGEGNIDADPMFFDANNPDPNLRDYHLRPGSPCIDAGDNNSVPADTADLDGDGNTTEPIPFDIDTDVRVSGGTVDMGSDEAIWASAADVNQGETVILNPGGGGTDPNEDALVVFENVSGPNDATIEVTEVGTDLYPDGLFRALGRTIRIDTSLADGEFFMTVTIPFDNNDLSGADPFTVDLLYWEQPPGKWPGMRSRPIPTPSNRIRRRIAGRRNTRRTRLQRLPS